MSFIPKMVGFLSIILTIVILTIFVAAKRKPDSHMTVDKLVKKDVIGLFASSLKAKHEYIREGQIIKGVLSFIGYNVNNYPIVWFDNTTDIVPEYFQSLDIQTVFTKENKGEEYCGLGVIQAFQDTQHIWSKYEWIIYFEPRQTLENNDILEQFEKEHSNIVLTDNNNILYTGMFILKSSILSQYLQTDTKEMTLEHGYHFESSFTTFIQNNVQNIKRIKVENSGIIRRQYDCMGCSEFY